MSSPPKVSEVGVKSLREKFNKPKATAQTPEKFMIDQRVAAEKEAKEILLSRKKAAAFNMAMRQLELKKTADAKIAILTSEEKNSREKLRAQARRVSHVLRQLDDSPARPAAEANQRRATQLMLASMAEDLEKELRIEEEQAVNDEREAARAADEAREQAARAEAERLANEQAMLAKKAKEEAEALEKAAKLAKEAAAAEELAAQAQRARNASVAARNHEEALKREEEQRRRKKEEDDARRQEEEEAALKARLEEEAEAKRKWDAEQAEAAKAAKALPPVTGESSERNKDRMILTSYLQENYPEKLDQVETLLVQFAGNLDVLFEELAMDQKFDEEDEDDVQTYKDGEDVVPIGSSSMMDKTFLKPGVDLKSVVTSFYHIYAPTKLDDIDSIIKHFLGREADLFRTLEVKYDVEFSKDGTCRPLDAERIGDPFLAQTSSFRGGASDSKFAVDVTQSVLKDKLKKQSMPPEKVSAVLSSGSGMM